MTKARYLVNCVKGDPRFERIYAHQKLSSLGAMPSFYHLSWGKQASPSGISDLDLWLPYRMLPLPYTQRICHQSRPPGRSKGPEGQVPRNGIIVNWESCNFHIPRSRLLRTWPTLQLDDAPRHRTLRCDDTR